jgi:hypothetical protein
MSLNPCKGCPAFYKFGRQWAPWCNHFDKPQPQAFAICHITDHEIEAFEKAASGEGRLEVLNPHEYVGWWGE